MSASLAACSLSAEGWIGLAFRNAGFSRQEARCAVRGAASQLDQRQLTELRTAFVSVSVAGLPHDAAAILAALGPRVDADTRRVLAHYADMCRRR